MAKLPMLLDCVGSIDEAILARLATFDELFQKSEYFDRLLEIRGIREIAEELESLVRMRGIVGYHFTRADPEAIRAGGLAACPGEEWRQRFMRDHSYRFTNSQLDRIRQLWSNYFQAEQCRIRDRKLYFTTTKRLGLVNVEHLYRYFGGEAVNMPLTHETDLMAILATIAKPLVVTCRLEVARLRDTIDDQYGRALVSAYHVGVNPEATWQGLGTYQTEALPPGEILEIQEIESP